ncbi:hypothetical protein HNQ56_001492 [Anaerotaenia torta]|uniref:ABC transporter substrate-binding protein n=1 Tax=Anaerotaenia torta TaxID=433293 RepID=UPI003D263891
MKLRSKKWMVLLLVCSMVLGMTGCGKDPKPAGGTKEDSQSTGSGGSETGDTETGDTGDDPSAEEQWDRLFDKYIQDEEPVDLNGYAFKVVDFHTSRWEPEEIKSPQDQLVCDIIEDVEKTYNCTIEFESVSPDVIFETAQPEIMAGGKYADLIGTTMWAFGKMLGGGLVRDLSDVETLDLSAPYWNKNVSDTATFGNSTYAFGGPFGSHFGNHWIIFYNSRIWNELGLPDPYEMVEKNEWTWAKLVEYSKLALRDNDGDGVVNSESDRWGMTAPSGDLIQSVFFGMGARYYKEDGNGHVRLDCIDPVSADKIDFMYNLYQTDNILYKNENVGYLEMFAAGKSLFLAYGNDAHAELKDMEDDFGVLPLPKWNAEQAEYQNAVDHNAPIFAMTTTNKNTYEAGIIITALGKRYQALEELKIQDMEDTFWRFDEDKEMVTKYIVGHGAYDVINIIKNANSNFEVPASVLFNGCYNNAYSDIVSTIASMEDALDVLLDEFFDNLSK